MGMNETLVLPDLGDNAQTGVVVRVAVKSGDELIAGATIVEVETDKVVLDIPVDMDCVVESLTVNEGDTVSTGMSLMVYRPLGEAADESTDTSRSAGVTESATPDSASTTSTIEARNEVAVIEPTPPVVIPQSLVPPTVHREPVKQEQHSRVIPAGPSTRRLAREIGVKIETIQGSGPRGRISVDDVKAYAAQQLRSDSVSDGVTPLPDLSEFGSVRREPLNGIDKATSDNMRRAWREIPHAWVTASFDIASLQQHRRRHRDAIAEAGGVLSLTTFIVKALAIVVSDFPRFNASLDSETQEIVYRDYIHIGVAVDTPRGLVVPVLRNVDQLNLMGVATSFADGIERARQGTLTPRDMRGGSITLSNLGGFGVDSIYPIINWPQSAIIGIGGSSHNGTAEMLPVTLAFDHRLINGADAARFLQALGSLLEDPFVFSLKS